jgi:2-keto-4-pentenoate hydratase/2-oxohepta-3-ene-1,7-dioic acid hydratase in catechol pathway
MGPSIVVYDHEAPGYDPHALGIRLLLNGKAMQDSNTRELVFKTPALIAHVSKFVTLRPGDVIFTGTPAGVGVGRKPQVFLKEGDDVVVEIESLGSLRNPVVAEQ